MDEEGGGCKGGENPWRDLCENGVSEERGVNVEKSPEVVVLRRGWEREHQCWGPVEKAGERRRNREDRSDCGEGGEVKQALRQHG